MIGIRLLVFLLTLFVPVQMQSGDGGGFGDVSDIGLIMLTMGGLVMLAIVCTWAWFCYMCIRIERDAKKKNKEIDLQHDAALAERRRAIAREIEMRDLRRLLLPIEDSIDVEQNIETETEMNLSELAGTRNASEDNSTDDWFFNDRVRSIQLVGEEEEEELPPAFEDVVLHDEQMGNFPAYPSSNHPPLPQQQRMLNTLQHLPQMTVSSMDTALKRENEFLVNGGTERNASPNSQPTQRAAYITDEHDTRRGMHSEIDAGLMGRNEQSSNHQYNHQVDEAHVRSRDDSLSRSTRVVVPSSNETGIFERLGVRASVNSSSVNEYRDNTRTIIEVPDGQSSERARGNNEEQFMGGSSIPISDNYLYESSEEEASESDSSTSSVDIDELISRHLSKMPRIGMVNVVPVNPGYRLPSANFQRFDPQMRVPIHPSRKLLVTNSNTSSHSNKRTEESPHPLSYSQSYIA